MKARRGRIGSSFDDHLKEEGIYEEVTARAIKRVIARQLATLMRDQGLTKSELAKRMHTSRAQLDRLLDPENEFRHAWHADFEPRTSWAGSSRWSWSEARRRGPGPVNLARARRCPAARGPPAIRGRRRPRSRHR